MNKDIVPELLEKIEKEFKNKSEKSEILKKKILALKNKNVTHKDSNEFAIEIGKILSEAFKGEIREDILPDNRIYYNIAKRIIEPNLKRNYDIVGDYSRNVQEVLNKKSNISLKAIKADLNQDRIDGIVNKISGYNTFEEGKWLLEEPIINFTQAIVDDTIKTNAEFQYKAGLRPKIIRKESGNCCKWCKEVVGVYEYPDVPKDVYRRHRFCRCTVDYLPGDGRKQDVWSKQWTDVDKDDKIEERKKFNYKKVNSKSNIIETAIKKGVVKDEINIEKQSRHLKENHLPGRSFLNGDIEFSKELYKEFRGKGQPIIVNNEWKNKERVNTGRIVATYVDDKGDMFDSSNIIIAYSKTGSHILGGRPDET